MSNDNQQICRACGPGWEKLILPLIEKANLEDATVLQVKEKFGGLRFYVSGGSDELYDMIDKAEDESLRTCEMCGAPGKLMKKGGWYKTVCAEDALSLGYKTRAQT